MINEKNEIVCDNCLKAVKEFDRWFLHKIQGGEGLDFCCRRCLKSYVGRVL